MTILLCATTTGYQTRAFEAAAASLGIDLVYATDRCHMLDDPWRDRAISVRFEEEQASIDAIVASARQRPISGVIAVGDRPVPLAALAARELGLLFHPVDGARVSRSKLLTRGRLLAAGLPVPWFFAMPSSFAPDDVADRLHFPCVIKPLGLSGSRGVIRANDFDELEAALTRVRALLERPDVRSYRDTRHEEVVIEGFIDGREYALEGIMEQGALRVFAIFEKPDPLNGPFFEETIYVTPPSLDRHAQRTLASAIAHAAAAIGLHHGPIHAECRANDAGIFVLEINARSIGGLCARALRFASETRDGVTLEELLLRHATGETLDGYGREEDATGVMMIPIPARGLFKRVDGIDDARAVAGVDDVVITAKVDQLIEPLPEGGSYLGFIFARARTGPAVTAALKAAHAKLSFTIDPALPVIS